MADQSSTGAMSPDLSDFYFKDDFYSSLAAPSTQAAINGTPGNDAIRPGNDTIHGTAGADDLQGGFGNDVIYGHGGADVIHGGGGADSLYGGGGADHLFGGDNADHLEGGAGNDWLYGGMGADYLKGGTGADTFAFDVHDVPKAGAVDHIADFRKGEHDGIDLHGFDNGTLEYHEQTGAFSYDFGDGHGAVDFLTVGAGKALELNHDYFIT